MITSALVASRRSVSRADRRMTGEPKPPAIAAGSQDRSRRM
jgi:hypothetical protein